MMPQSAPKPCTQCGALVRDGSARCEAHKVVLGTFADARRGTRQQRGYGAEWMRQRRLVLARDAGLCQPCLRMQRVTAARDVDHVVPKAQGGTDESANLQAICRDCHRAKTAREGAQGRTAATQAQRAPTQVDATPGGHENPRTIPLGTGREVKFMGARVSGGGGSHG